MPKFPKKVCSNPTCGTIFQPRREDHEYCSSSCRTQAFRKRHELEEPAFLSPLKKPIETSLKAIEVPSNPPINTNSSSNKAPDFADIGVTEYIANPAYLKAAKEFRDCWEKTLLLQKKRGELKSELHQLNGGQYKMWGATLGGLAIAALGFLIIHSKAKNASPLWFFLLVPATIVGAMVGGSLAVDAYFGSDKSQKLEQADEKEKEILQIEQEIIAAKTKANDIKLELGAVQKQIARYETATRDEDYVEFRDISNQKAVSLESLKSKKFKTLEFSDKWQDLIGTPEANFCMMVYGKPGQGKSYFTLELSEYLASNFGTVLFNSSEEGSSLSLQNKVVNLNSENIFLGRADDIKPLQFLLTQSPYKFVVIDSINHMNITPEDLRKLRVLHPTKGFICILQSTKSGDFKGSNEFEHDADVSIKIDNRIPECVKTRYK